MKFCWATLHVADMAASLMFYQDIVGLPVQQRFQAGPKREIVFLGDSDTKVELISDEVALEQKPTDTLSLGFEVPLTLEEVLTTLKSSGLKNISDIQSPGPNIRFFYVLDPDGYKVQFVQHV